MVAVLDHRYQAATRWVEGASTSGFGPSSWTRSYLTVRWEERTELFVDRSGSEQKGKAVVYTDLDLNVGDFLALGTSTEASPIALTSALEIKDFRRIPDLKGNFYEKRALMSVSGSL
jgi:hypothetical protein